MSNLEILKELYGNHFREEKVLMIKSINNQPFFMIGEQDISKLSVYSGGYILLPTNQFVEIFDNQDHADVLSYFIHLYFNDNTAKEYSSTESTIILNKAGIGVYFGIRLKHLSDLEAKGYQSINDDRNATTGLLSIPSFDPFFRDCAENLQATNQKELVKLTIGNIEKGITYDNYSKPNQKRL